MGERFSPTPPFFTLVWRAPGDVVLPSRVAAAALPPYLSASGGQLFIALRATAESLRCAAFTCVALAPCSFAWRKGVRSHPLRGAYRACCAGLKRRVGFTSMDIFPTAANMVGVLGFEPRTSSLSGTRSNQLSYTPSSPKSCLPFGHGPQEHTLKRILT